MKEDKLLHRELSYYIRGLFFEIQNELGRFCNEKQYGDSFEEKLKRDQKVIFEREKILSHSFTGERPHRNRIDFLINNILIIELKCAPALTKEHYHQCQRYLAVLKLDLALLVNFRPKFVMIKRVLNHEKFNKEKTIKSGQSGLSGNPYS